ncbi:hypothetical protein EJD97_008930 [Solanum chilense]|uniref:Pectinesterase catalytic domain-containing protein n=1 Tax=Solanum chilense TaxID=4083 RepID=A0A6N2BTK9_SOLCI|nr:hypothetical protein EJD97_008930 [Solanum chilense]
MPSKNTEPIKKAASDPYTKDALSLRLRTSISLRSRMWWKTSRHGLMLFPWSTVFGETITETTGLTRKLLSNSDSFVEASSRKLLQISPSKSNAVVSASGDRQYKTISGALNAVPTNYPTPFIILIKASTYKEHIEIEKTGSKNGGGVVKWHTTSLGVSGERFVIRDIGIENAAGPEKEQVVALGINADKAIVYNYKIDGFQYILYAHSYR